MQKINYNAVKVSSQQSGFVLITGLIFLVILTLVISFGLSHSNLEFKMSKNAAESLRAFNNSEGARTVAVEAFQDYTYYGVWDDADAAEPGTQPRVNLSVINTAKNLNIPPPSGVVLTDHSTVTDQDGDGNEDLPDLSYSLNGQNTNIYVIKTQSQKAPGDGQGANEGDSGNASAGSYYFYYEVRADGKSDDAAESLTASDLRIYSK